MTREELLRRLRHRVDRVLRDGDPRPVLDPDALAEAAALFEAGPPDDEVRYVLGWFFFQRFEAYGETEGQRDIAAALTMFGGLTTRPAGPLPDPIEWYLSTTAVDSADDDPMSQYLRAMRLLAERRTELRPDDLDTAVDLLRGAAAAAPPERYERAMFLSGLGLALRQRFEYNGRPDDLAEAVATARMAVEATLPGHEDLMPHLTNLANVLLLAHGHTGAREPLDQAVEAAWAAVRRAPDDHVDRPAAVNVLALALKSRFVAHGDRADIDEAVEVCRAAIEGTPPTNPGRVPLLSTMTGLLFARFERGHDPADLDEAVRLARAGHAGLAADDPLRHTVATNLGIFLEIRYRWRGDTADLDEAITLTRTAIDALPPDHPKRAIRLANLGGSLLVRYHAQGDLADIDAAIVATRRALAGYPVTGTHQAGLRSNLSAMFRERFDRTGDRADLDASATESRAAVRAAPPGHYRFPELLQDLSIALLARHQETGDSDDLDEAVEVAQRAVAALTDGYAARGGVVGQLANALLARYWRDGAPVDLTTAIDRAGEAAEAFPDGHLSRSRHLMTRAQALREHSLATGRATDGDAARRAYRGCATAAGSEPTLRLAAAQSWMDLAGALGDWADAARAAQVAIETLPLVTHRRIGARSRQHHLAQHPGLAADAAAVALELGDPVYALRLLEQSRGILLGQVLDTRGDLAELRRSRPDLAAEVDGLRRLLDGEVWASEGDDGLPVRDENIERRRYLASRWERLLADIRAIPPFERFLAAPDVTELLRAAEDGPIIVLNASLYRCDALIVTTAGVEVVPLTTLRLDDAHDRARTLLAAAHDDSEDGYTAVGDVLAWLWDSVVGPVLKHLDLTGTPTAAGRTWRRVWWLPTGPLTVLPLHAAGTADVCALDLVASSYTPTLRALHRGRLAGGRSGTSLVVANDGGPQAPLPHALKEAQAVARHLGVEPVTGGQATRAAVLTGLAGARWAHFACHASSDPVDPTGSALGLADGPLLVRELVGLDLGGAELAYLSACTSAFGGVRVPDEAVHIASAFQLVGFRHVIGTLWPVVDSVARMVVDYAYREMTTSGAPPWLAVHQASRRMRTLDPGAPYLWAPYVHIGA